MTSTDTTPPPPPPPPAEPEKEKKDGFNSHTRFGIRGGGIISKQILKVPPHENPESKFGGDLAILAAFPIGGGFFIVQPELHWLQKGYKLDAITGNNITSTLNYLELPLLLRVNFGGSLEYLLLPDPVLGTC